MVLYTVRLEDNRFGVKEDLIDTTDEKLALKTLGVVKEFYSAKNINYIRAIICKRYTDTKYTWWYADSFKKEFVDHVFNRVFRLNGK